MDPAQTPGAPVAGGKYPYEVTKSFPGSVGKTFARMHPTERGREASFDELELMAEVEEDHQSKRRD